MTARYRAGVRNFPQPGTYSDEAGSSECASCIGTINAEQSECSLVLGMDIVELITIIAVVVVVLVIIIAACIVWRVLKKSRKDSPEECVRERTREIETAQQCLRFDARV